MLHFIVLLVLAALSISLIIQSVQLLDLAKQEMDLTVANNLKNRAMIFLGFGIGGGLFTLAYFVVLPFIYGVGSKKEGFHLSASEYFNGGEY